jgi:mannosyltransferase
VLRREVLPTRAIRAVAPVLVAASACLAAVLGVLHLGRHSLWLDEAVTAQLAHLQAGPFVHLVSGREANSVAYFTLVRGVAAVFGNGETAVRSLSVVATAVTVMPVFLVARDLFDERTGVIAALLFAVSPAAVVSAQEARGFARDAGA